MSPLPPDDEVRDWVDRSRDRIVSVADRRNVPLRVFACTLPFVASYGQRSICVHIGDGCAVLRASGPGAWIAPLWPDHGEYASTTHFLTDEPEPRLRIARFEESVDAVVAFTDGLERLALDFARKEPFAAFLDSVSRPVREEAIPGRDAKLCAGLDSFLQSDRVNSRTDDDKTLVIAVSI